MACDLLSKLVISPSVVLGYTLKEILYFKNRIWLGNKTTIHQKVMAALLRPWVSKLKKLFFGKA